MTNENELTLEEKQLQTRAQEILTRLYAGNLEDNLKLFAVLAADMEFVIEQQAKEIKALRGK